MKKLINEAKRMQQLAGLITESQSNEVDQLTEIRQLVRKIIQESLNENVDIKTLVNIINAAKRSGQEIAVNGEPVNMWIAAVGKLRTMGGSYSIYDIASGDAELTIDGEPVELPAYVAPEPKQPGGTGDIQSWLDRYGPGGGQDTFAGTYTGD
jgi:hypothetical protein